MRLKSRTNGCESNILRSRLTGFVLNKTSNINITWNSVPNLHWIFESHRTHRKYLKIRLNLILFHAASLCKVIYNEFTPYEEAAHYSEVDLPLTKMLWPEKFRWRLEVLCHVALMFDILLTINSVSLVCKIFGSQSFVLGSHPSLREVVMMGNTKQRLSSYMDSQ